MLSRTAPKAAPEPRSLLAAHVPLYDWLFLLIGGIDFILLGWTLARRPGIWHVVRG